MYVTHIFSPYKVVHDCWLTIYGHPLDTKPVTSFVPGACIYIHIWRCLFCRWPIKLLCKWSCLRKYNLLTDLDLLTRLNHRLTKSLPAACEKTASSSWFKEGQARSSKVKQLDFLLMLEGGPWPMLSFHLMLEITGVSPHVPSVDHSAPLGHLGRWAAHHYVPPLDDRGVSPALWLLASAFPQEWAQHSSC